MNSAPKMWRVVVTVAAAAVLAAACDFQKISNQATATKVVVATLLTTPAVELKAGAVAGNGLDASIPAWDASIPDGGFSFDAGGFLADAGYTLPPQTLAVVFFGERGASLDVAPTGVAGAVVTLTEVGGKSWPLTEGSGGSYSLSGEDAGFAYKDGATYDFTVKHQNQEYVAELEKVPAQEHITQFHPAAGYIDQVAGQPFTFTRPDPATGQDRPLGFVQVYPVSGGAQGQPTWSNVPTTPLQFLKLIAAPSDWKQTQVTIPGSAFPDKDHNYVIILQSAKIGGPKSENLFTGSAILGGTADVAIVKTQK